MKRSKRELLRDFTAVLFRSNPMGLVTENPLEYEREALSILCAFVEAGLDEPYEGEDILPEAIRIVDQVLQFWFEDAELIDNKLLARELIATYMGAPVVGGAAN